MGLYHNCSILSKRFSLFFSLFSPLLLKSDFCSSFTWIFYIFLFQKTTFFCIIYINTLPFLLKIIHFMSSVYMYTECFFSVHYLTIYYLLQPYNISTEIKSGTYQLVLSATYLVCFFMMRWKMPIFLFGLMAIAFCVVYCVIACILIYRFAPKTFRLRT